MKPDNDNYSRGDEEFKERLIARFIVMVLMLMVAGGIFVSLFYLAVDGVKLSIACWQWVRGL